MKAKNVKYPRGLKVCCFLCVYAVCLFFYVFVFVCVFIALSV